MRPSILNYILKQKYSVLWTDSDMVWLENPLPLLPDMEDPSAVRLVMFGLLLYKCSGSTLRICVVRSFACFFAILQLALLWIV